MTHPLVLMYHAVSDDVFDPWLLRVPRSHFEKQLRALVEDWDVVALAQLVEGMSSGNLPERAVAITFDDGYANVVTDALPLLEQYDVPATVFICTGPVIEQREFWWEQLEWLLLSGDTLPETLEVTFGGLRHRWSLGLAARDVRAATAAYPDWRAHESPPTALHQAYLALARVLRVVDEAERASVLEQLAHWARRASALRPGRRPLTRTDLAQLAASALIEVGAHTVTHPWLPTLASTRRIAELREGRQWLEAALGRSVRSFAYPYGAYSEEVVGEVRSLGFAYSCTVREECVLPSTSRWEIPRFGVEHWTGEEFRRRLETWASPTRT